jgi:hypothetical protein
MTFSDVALLLSHVETSHASEYARGSGSSGTSVPPSSTAPSAAQEDWGCRLA